MQRELPWSLWLGCLALLLSAGCAGDPKRQGMAGAENRILTAEAAKGALLEMDWTQIQPGVQARRPKDEPIKVIEEDRISVGEWRCNLKGKTFYAAFHYPGAFRHESNEVSGVFQPAPDGKWVAKVTSQHD